MSRIVIEPTDNVEMRAMKRRAFEQYSDWTIYLDESLAWYKYGRESAAGEVDYYIDKSRAWAVIGDIYRIGGWDALFDEDAGAVDSRVIDPANKAIRKPNNICMRCLSQADVFTISIGALGYGSYYDMLETRLQLCPLCYSNTNPVWWELNVIAQKDEDGIVFDEEYEYEREIIRYTSSMPLAGQELLINRFSDGEHCGVKMRPQDWIDYKLGILPPDRCKEYGYVPPQDV